MLIEHGGIDECYNTFLKKIEQFKSRLHPESIMSSKNGFTDATKNTYLLIGVRNVFIENRHIDGDEIFGGDSFTSDEDYEEYIYFKDILESEFATIFSNTIKAINSQINSVTLEDERKTVLVGHLTTLEFWHNKAADINTYGLLEFIRAELIKIVQYVNGKFRTIIPTHSAYELTTIANPAVVAEVKERDIVSGKTTTKDKEESQEIPYHQNRFGFHGKPSQVISLYEALEDAGLFSPDIDQSEQFRNILFPTSTMVVNLHPVRVNCTNGEAAYIFKCLKRYFDKFTIREIGKSESFLNKSKGKPFKEGDFSRALRPFEEKAEYDSATQRKKNRIDQALSTLNFKR